MPCGKNSKYKKAVLSAKLANLEIVAARQRKLLKKAEEAQELLRVHDVIEQQEGLLDKKVIVLRELQDNQGNGQIVLHQVSKLFFHHKRKPALNYLDENAPNPAHISAHS